MDQSIKIVNNTAKLPSSGRKKQCAVCKKTFSTAKELVAHRKTHESESESEEEVKEVTPPKRKPRVAPGRKPTKTTPGKNTIKNYFKKAEPKKRKRSSYRCDTCDVDFSSIEEIKGHPNNKCRFVCEVCSRSYNMMYAFTVHVLQHKINLFKTEAPDKLHKCTLCAESFDDYIDLKTHGILMHKGKTSQEPPNTETNGSKTELSCELCFDIFESEEELKEHMEFHEQLGDTGKGAAKKSSTVVDTEDDSQDTIDIDDHNAKVATECMARDVKVELQPIPVIESSYSLAEDESNGSSSATICEDASNSGNEEPATPAKSPPATTAEEVSSVKQEEAKESPPEPTAEQSSGYEILPASVVFPKKHYKCKVCERVYTCVEEYDAHLESACTIEKICPVCPTAVRKNSDWYAHVTEKHQMWSTCKFCFEAFTEVTKLDQHKMQKHFNTFKNVCKICFKCFMTYQEFDDHLKNEHLNI